MSRVHVKSGDLKPHARTSRVTIDLTLQDKPHMMQEVYDHLLHHFSFYCHRYSKLYFNQRYSHHYFLDLKTLVLCSLPNPGCKFYSLQTYVVCAIVEKCKRPASTQLANSERSKRKHISVDLCNIPKSTQIKNLDTFPSQVWIRDQVEVSP